MMFADLIQRPSRVDDDVGPRIYGAMRWDESILPPGSLWERRGDGAADNLLEMTPATLRSAIWQISGSAVADGQAVILSQRTKPSFRLFTVSLNRSWRYWRYGPVPASLGPLRQGVIPAAAQQIAEIARERSSGAIGMQPGKGHADEQGAGSDRAAGEVDFARAEILEIAEDPESRRDQSDDHQNREGRDRQHCDSRKLHSDPIRRHCTLSPGNRAAQAPGTLRPPSQADNIAGAG
jgi:hypothetical protein